MAEGLLTREPISDYGEFRVYLRPEREELVFEAFREQDGRAWLLRVPTRAQVGHCRPLARPRTAAGQKRDRPRA